MVYTSFLSLKGDEKSLYFEVGMKNYLSSSFLSEKSTISGLLTQVNLTIVTTRLQKLNALIYYFNFAQQNHISGNVKPRQEIIRNP